MKTSMNDFSLQVIDLTDNLKGFAYSLTRNEEDSNDLVQETILKALLNKKGYKSNTNLKAWLYTIMKNIFINNYRKEKKLRLVFDGSKELYQLNVPEPGKMADPERQLQEKEVIMNMLSLDKEFKGPLQMYYQGFKYREIADELELPIGTVKNRIFLGRKMLAEKMALAG